MLVNSYNFAGQTLAACLSLKLPRPSGRLRREKGHRLSIRPTNVAWNPTFLDGVLGKSQARGETRRTRDSPPAVVHTLCRQRDLLFI